MLFNGGKYCPPLSIPPSSPASSAVLSPSSFKPELERETESEPEPEPSPSCRLSNAAASFSRALTRRSQLYLSVLGRVRAVRRSESGATGLGFFSNSGDLRFILARCLVLVASKAPIILGAESSGFRPDCNISQESGFDKVLIADGTLAMGFEIALSSAEATSPAPRVARLLAALAETPTLRTSDSNLAPTPAIRSEILLPMLLIGDTAVVVRLFPPPPLNAGIKVVKVLLVWGGLKDNTQPITNKVLRSPDKNLVSISVHFP